MIIPYSPSVKRRLDTPAFYGKARGAIDYFSSLRIFLEIAMNPEEFLLDLLATRTGFRH